MILNLRHFVELGDSVPRPGQRISRCNILCALAVRHSNSNCWKASARHGPPLSYIHFEPSADNSVLSETRQRPWRRRHRTRRKLNCVRMRVQDTSLRFSLKRHRNTSLKRLIPTPPRTSMHVMISGYVQLELFGWRLHTYSPRSENKIIIASCVWRASKIGGRRP